MQTQGTHIAGPVSGIDFHLKEVVIEDGADGLAVYQVWAGVDRPHTCSVGVTTRAMGERLARAMRAGVAYPASGVRQDIFGKTYVATEMNVVGRRLGADLKRLGY